MKYYFDHRGLYGVYVDVFVDNEYFGKVQARRECITVIDISDCSKSVRLSFSNRFDKFNELDKKEITNFDFDFVKEPIKVDDGVYKNSWQFPYDIEIDTANYKEDMVLYPAEFVQDELKGGLYYRVKSVSSGNFIEMRLIKRMECFGIEEFRKKELIKYFLGLVFSIVGLPVFMHLYIMNEMNPAWNRAFGGGIVICVIGLIMTLLALKSIWNYSGMYKENKMKKEYFFTEDGELK